MDADERTANRIANVVVGLIGLGALWLLAQFVPAFVAAVLMTGSFLVLLLALIGFIKPSWVRLPNRLAGVWLIALSVGMFVGGGVLLNQGEDEISTANGSLTVNPDGSTSSAVAPGSQAQGGILPHERPSADMTDSASSEPKTTEQVIAEARRVADMLSRRAPEQALAEAQRVVDENARNRREARGLPEAVVVRHRNDPTRWENPEPWLAAACSPEEIGVRICIGVDGTTRSVLLESSLPQPAGDRFTVVIGNRTFTARVEPGLGNLVWTRSEANAIISAMRSGSSAAMGDVIGPGGQAIVTDADGMEFRVSLRGAITAIDQALR